MARSDEQTNVRIPADLKYYLTSEATLARRSLTAEVVTRLERTRQQDKSASAGRSTPSLDQQGAAK